jgi:hypothetical protein
LDIPWQKNLSQRPALRTPRTFSLSAPDVHQRRYNITKCDLEAGFLAFIGRIPFRSAMIPKQLFLRSERMHQKDEKMHITDSPAGEKDFARLVV